MRTNHVNKPRFLLHVYLWIGLLLIAPSIRAQSLPAKPSPLQEQTTQEFNQRLEPSPRTAADSSQASWTDEYRIGPNDVLAISVFEAPEMNCTLRVSANGEISMQLLGPVKAAGLTPRELESVLRQLLRQTYMKDPHVGVFVQELQSRPVSVVGAVKQPGVFQIQGTKTVIELISMAQGLTDDAGDTVLITRGAALGGSPDRGMQDPTQKDAALSLPDGKPPLSEGANPLASTNEGEIDKINLKDLMESQDSSLNVAVHPGDIVKVTRAGIVYVVGEVGKPGGFVLKNNENVSVLQALALAQGLTRTAAKSQVRIIRTDPKTDKRIEIPVNLGKILTSKAPDVMLQTKDIVFVPNSFGKTTFYRGTEAALVTATGVAIYGRY